MSDLFKRLAALLVFIALAVGEFALLGRKQVTAPVQENTGAETENDGYAAAPAVNRLDLESNRYVHPAAEGGPGRELSTEGFDKLLENDRLELWMRTDCCDIRVVNKENGYVWGGIEESTTKDLNKRWKKVASSLLTVNYLNSQLTEETAYLADEGTGKTWECVNGEVRIHCTFPDIGLKAELSLTLNENTLTVSLPDDGLREGADFPVTSVTFLPFFGAARLDETNGYFFLPDGCGALMRFTEGREYISSFARRVYGNDLGIESADTLNGLSDVALRPVEFAVPEREVMMPVYGAVHGVHENAFLTEITGGAEYARILADPAAPRLNYHYIRTEYIYREAYIQPTSQNGSGVRVVQSVRNSVDPCQTYTFLTGEDADYSGMARAYRASLEKRGVLTRLPGTASPALCLRVIAAVRDRGMLTNSTVLSTGAAKILEIADALEKAGAGDTLFVLDGAFEGGTGGYDLKNASLEGELADGSTLEDLNARICAAGGRMLLRFDPIRLTEDQYTLRTDIATRISQQPIVISAENDTLLFPETRYRKNGQISLCTDNALRLAAEHGLDCCAAGIGELLYSDHQKNEGLTRTQAMNGRKTLAAQAGVAAVEAPYAFMWGNVRTASGLPMSASQYLYETDTVPFLQMVVHGSITLYAPAANENGMSTGDALRCIEYGQYPSFVITGSDNYTLKDSALTGVYSSCWDTLESDVARMALTVKEALNGLESTRVISHDALGTGTVRVTYENGTRIYVNYGTVNAEADGYTVPARGYLRADTPEAR